MNTMDAFARGLAAQGRPMMVFDWERAARRIVEAGAQAAAAGLQGDWGYTGGEIFKDGKPVPQEDAYVYLASTWATPQLELNCDVEDCWRYQADSPGWDHDTYWPPEALAILNTPIDATIMPDHEVLQLIHDHGYEIDREPHVSGAPMGWAWSHKNYDGPPDRRCGWSRTLAVAWLDIQEREEQENDR